MDAAPEPPKGRGRPKGRGKVPGSGRQKGTANKTTQQLRALIHRRGKPVEVVCRVASGKEVIEGLTQAEALKLLFKAVIPELRGEIISGPDGGPVQREDVTYDRREVAKRIGILLTEAATESGAPPAGAPATASPLDAAPVSSAATAAPGLAPLSNGAICDGGAATTAQPTLPTEDAPVNLETNTPQKKNETPEFLEYGQAAYCGEYLIKVSKPDRDGGDRRYTIYHRPDDGWRYARVTSAVHGLPGAIKHCRKIGPPDAVVKIIREEEAKHGFESVPGTSARPDAIGGITPARPEVHHGHDSKRRRR